MRPFFGGARAHPSNSLMSDLHSFLDVAEGHQGSILPAIEPVGEQTSLGRFDDLLCQGDSSSMSEVLQPNDVESETPPPSGAFQNQPESLSLIGTDEGSESAVVEGLQGVSSPSEGPLDETLSPLQTEEARTNLLPISGALDIAARRQLLLGRKQRHVCHVCGRECPSKHKLRRHLSTHSQDRPFNCHVCGKNFKWTEYLAKHMRQQHSGAGVEDGQHESTASGTASPSSSSQQSTQSQSSALACTEDHASGIDVAMETNMDASSVDTSLENTSALDNSALLGNRDAFTEDLQQHPDGPSHLEAVGAPSDMSLPEPVVTPSQQPQLMSPDSMQTQPADSSMLPIPPELIPVPSNQLAMEGIPPSEATPLQQSLLPLEGVSPNQTSPLPPNLLPLEGGSSNTIPQLQSHLLASLGGISPSNAPPFVPPTNAMPTLQSNLLSLHNNGITQAHSSQTQLPPATAAEIMSQLGIQLSEDGAQQLLSPSQLHLQQTAAGNGMAAASSYSMASSGPYAAVSSAEAYGSVSSGSYYASSEGYTAPSGDGYTAPSGDGYTVPSSNGYTAGNSGSFTASSSDGYTAASSGSFTGPSSYGSTAPSSDGYTAPSSDGYTAASSDGYTAASSDGYTAASNDGYVAPSSDGYVAPSSDGYTVASSGSFTASSNTGYVAPSSGGYNADGSVVASTGTPFMAGSMAGSMTGSADAYATAIPLDPSTANFNQGGVSLPPVTFPVDMATQQLQTQATNTAVNMLPSVPQQSNVPVDMNQIYNYDNLGMTQTSPFMATPPNVGGFSAAGSGMQESMQSTVQLSSQPQVQLQPLMSSSQAEQPRTIIVREEIEVVREPPAKRSKNETVSVGIQCEVGQETVAALREEERVAHAQGVYPSAELEIEASAIQIPDGGGGGGGEKSVVMMAREAYTEGGAQYQATNGAGSQDVSSGDVIISPSHHHHHHHPAFPQEEKVVQKYPCEMDTCSKAYIHRKDLIRHMKVRHGISPQKLEPVAVENPEKPYTCPISGCGRSYCHLKDLRRHQRQCHTVNSTTADEGACESVDGEGKTMLRFPCDFPGCMRSYVHKKDLVRHKRLYHNDASSKPSVPIPVRYTEAELKRIKQEEKSERAAESDEKLDKLEKQRLTSTGSTVSTSGAEDPPNSATIMETERNHVLPDSADLASLTASGIMENLSINVVVRGDLASQAESAANALLATPEGTTVSSRSNSSAMSDLASSNSNHPPANSSSHEMISDGSVLSQDSLSQHRFIQQSLEKPQLPNATRTDDLAATTNPSMPISEISGSGGGVYPGSRSISYNMGALEEAFAHASEGGVIYGFSQQPKTTTSSLQPQQQPQQQQEQLQDGSSTQYDPTTVLNHPLSTTNTNTLQSSAASLQSVVSELQLLTSTQGVSPLSQGTF